MKNNLKYILLILVGFISIFGKLIGNEKMIGLGFISASSPLPLVFSQFRGVEGFALSYIIDYQVDGSWKKLKISPEVYAQLAGPYNRRNVFGAAMAGAPMLTGKKESRLIKRLHKYSLCDGPLAKELGIDKNSSRFIVHIKSETLNDNRTWKVETHCND